MQFAALCPCCFQETIGPEGLCTRCSTPSDGGRGRFPQGMALYTVLHERYLVGNVLGAGGFGITYLALDIATQQRCAVKEFFPAELAHRAQDRVNVVVPAGRQEEAEYGLQRFYEEAEVLLRLTDCPAVVHVQACFRENNTAYMVMDYITGPSLKQYCREHTHLDFQRGQTLFIDLCLTLSEIHRQGLLHRDISPENILLPDDGSARLIDFGAARYVMGERSKSLSVVLKKGYAPPEQYSSHGRQGPWTDLYALAGTFYFAFTGEHMLDAMDRLAGQKQPPLAVLRPDIPGGFSQILERCLALDHRQRIQSAQEVLEQVISADWYRTQERRESVTLPQNAVRRRSWLDALRGLHLPKKQLVLEMLSGPLNGQTFPLTRQQTVIGRSESDCMICLAFDPDISRQHCCLTRGKKEEIVLTDMSSNGTFLADGRRLVPGQPYPLKPDEVFYLANRQNTMRVTKLRR